MNVSEDVLTIVQDYFDLLKSVHTGKRPESIRLDEDDYDLLIADGITYDFSDIPHDDQLNTGRRMEIEALYCEDPSFDEIQSLLNEKVQKEW